MRGGAEGPLVPSLSLLDATAIGVGAIIGAGIFVVTGIAAGHAGSALVLSMVIAAAVSLLTALSFAELTAWLPTEGSVYELGRRLLSPFAGFLAGWMWIVSNTFGGAAVALGSAHSLAAFAPALPVTWTAALVCLGLTALNYVGVRQSALLNNALVLTKLLILGFFCAFGLVYVRSAHFAPFEPFRWGVLSGAGYIFFAYGGFARIAVMAEEVVDARRNVPRAILLSLMISTAVYVLVGAVAIGLVGPARLAASGAPLTTAIAASGHRAAVYVVSAGGLVATASVLLTSILGVSRMAYAMARRGDLPSSLTVLDPTHETPARAVWMTGSVMALLVLFVDLTRVVAISTFALLFCYGIANLSAARLAVPARRYPRFVPAAGVATCLALLGVILFISPRAWWIGIAGLAVGGLGYAVSRFRRLPRGE